MGALDVLARRHATAHPLSAARRLQEHPAETAALFLADLEPGITAVVLGKMSPGNAAAILDRFTIDGTVRVLETLDLATTVMLLRQLSVDSRAAIVDALPASLGRRVSEALAFRRGTVGSIVDSTVTAFDVDAPVSEVRVLGPDPRLPYVYVVGPEHQLVGVVHRRDLERTDADVKLRSIMRTRLQTVAADAPLAGLANHSAWSMFDTLPVVDSRDTFIGIIQHKSLRTLPQISEGEAGSRTAVTALLDLGEVYWSGLFSAIEALASIGPTGVQGEVQ